MDTALAYVSSESGVLRNPEVSRFFPSDPPKPTASNIKRVIDELEDLPNIAKDRHSVRRGSVSADADQEWLDSCGLRSRLARFP